MKNMNEINCPECGNEELTFDFRNQYYEFYICKNCGNKIRVKKENEEQNDLIIVSNKRKRKGMENVKDIPIDRDKIKEIAEELKKKI